MEGRLEVVAVPDMTVNGAFDEAMKSSLAIIPHFPGYSLTFLGIPRCHTCGDDTQFRKGSGKSDSRHNK